MGAAASGCGGRIASDSGDAGPTSIGGALACGASGFPSSYFLAIGTTVDPEKPFVSRVDITAVPSGGGLELVWVLQPLLWYDRKTLVGSQISLPPITPAADGEFATAWPPISFPGELNPFDHSPLTVEVTSLRGHLCGAAAFACGEVDAKVIKPTPQDVSGSSWTLTKVTDAASYPEPPPVNCDKELAVPVDSL
jgi:hypothetical protein